MASSQSILSPRRKAALIIGNNNYSRSESRLRHSINDANDLSGALENMNFDVTTNYDLTNAEMISTMSCFSNNIEDGNLILFYFSGHGYQVNGKNYLMPIDDTNIQTEDDVEDYAIPVERTINRFAARNPSYVTIFILDCCRKYWPKNIPKTRATMEGKGLHEIQAPAGTYIQFACAANQTASDGLENERNGLFTKHLLQHISTPNKDILQIFKKVGSGVYIESKKAQRPLGMNSLYLEDDVYLNELTPVNSVKSSSHSHNTMSQSIVPSSIPTETFNQIRLILLGTVGSGKSSFGNTILGEKMFHQSSSVDSVTTACTVGSRLFDGKQILVVDTPGFFDTAVSNETIIHEIAKSYQMTIPGPHAFLLVINAATRFTREQIESLTNLDRIFGPQAIHHTIIVFTHFDYLEDITIEEHLAELKPNHPLKQLLDRCEQRYLAVNNKGSQFEKDAVVRKLIEMISRLIENNNGKVYRPDYIDAVDKAVEAAKSGGYSYQPFNSDGTINLLPEVKKIVIDGYLRRRLGRKDIKD